MPDIRQIRNITTGEKGREVDVKTVRGWEGGGEQIFDGNLNVVYANNWDKNEEKIILYAYWVPNSEMLTAQIQELKNANAALTGEWEIVSKYNLIKV